MPLYPGKKKEHLLKHHTCGGCEFSRFYFQSVLVVLDKRSIHGEFMDDNARLEYR
ncbi:hypothetical protein C5S53_05905 [Methanophagales archaeon]|nr:hypothetical protein C5S53_05905 [Methanophagales archaeon]